jgi:hypothetical protein
MSSFVSNFEIMKKTLLLFIILIPTFLFATEKNITGTVRGTVIDKFSQQSIPGANVIVPGSSPVIGTTTDINGKFRLEGLPVGRISIQITFIGYKEAFFGNLEVESGKETVVEVELEENVTKMNEVVVTGERRLDEPINELAAVSATQFSIEESKRFAGARNDVARMATNFAGVASNNDAVNDIVIRGNSPNGLLWRLEGVDIPNPNHFGQAGAAGGPVSILNNNVLSNSDFMTGAFPAEYGNALSGVFDLRMRNGNDENHEFMGQIGFNGFELGAEGPISKANGSSYLVNARYSTLAVFDAMGINFGTGTAVPEYQDVTFKFNFPTKKAGTFSLFGIAGNSSIDFIKSNLSEDEIEQDFYSNREEDLRARSRMGAAGLTHKYFWGKKTYTKFILSGSFIETKNDIDSIIPDIRETFDWYDGKQTNTTLTATAFVNHKLNSRHLFRAGFYFTQFGYDLDETIYESDEVGYRKFSDANGQTYFAQPFATWQYRITEKLTTNAGVHGSFLFENEQLAVEPRLSLSYQALPRHRFGIAYGLHTQAPPVSLMFAETYIGNGQTEQFNTNLGFTQSQHFVLSYNFQTTENAHFRAEAYYQLIDDAIVGYHPFYYSQLNSGSFFTEFPDTLVNGGTGYNYGLELTYSRFLKNGLYYMLTGSLFSSRYTGSDGVERSTAFDGRYIFNAVGGYELQLAKKSEGRFKQFMTFDGKFAWAGGNPYIPVDKERTIASGEVHYDFDNAFSERLDDYMRLDLRVGYKMMFKKWSQEFALDVQNVTNRQNPYALNFNPETGEEEYIYQLGLFPVFQYRVNF